MTLEMTLAENIFEDDLPKTEITVQRFAVITVIDPETWTSPWTASIPMRLSNLPLYEYACHEGNYSMPNILSGQRAAEKEAAATATAKQ